VDILSYLFRAIQSAPAINFNSLVLSVRDSLKKRRDATRVIHDILLLVDNPVAKTHIVHSANLNFTLVRNYLDFLLSKGYVEHDNTHANGFSRYALTERGRHLLEVLKEVETELYGLFPSDRRHQGRRARILQ